MREKWRTNLAIHSTNRGNPFKQLAGEGTLKSLPPPLIVLLFLLLQNEVFYFGSGTIEPTFATGEL